MGASGSKQIFTSIQSNDAAALRKALESVPHGDQSLLSAHDPSDRQRTPLIEAVRRNNAVAVSYLLMHGADPNSRDDMQASALHYAITPSAIDQLLGGGANPDARNKFGATPLSLCVGQGDLRKAAALVLAGASLNVVDRRGWSPLDCALHWESNSTDPHTSNVG